MSNQQHIDYIEQKWDVFQGALADNDFSLAQAVIHDLLDAGLEDDAFYFVEQLQKSELYDRYEVKPTII